MENRPSSAAATRRPTSPRPSTRRQRSTSLPIVEALGCSTPEARLLMAEGTAAVHRRRACSQRSRSIPQDPDTPVQEAAACESPKPNATYNPRDHLAFLINPGPPALSTQSSPVVPRSTHTRSDSVATDSSSTSTIVPQKESSTDKPASPLGDYSANLAQFIKAQLNSIPAYAHVAPSQSALSPHSCPDLTFSLQTPPHSPAQITPRARVAPSLIEIPAIRPPQISQFSAWSSASGDDELDDDASLFPNVLTTADTLSAMDSQSTPFLGYYEGAHETSFLFELTPAIDEINVDDLSGRTPSNPSTMPSLSPGTSSSTSAMSYFDCKQPLITPELRDAVVAAVTPPAMYGKTLSAISPWDGAPLANVHDVVVESQQRVHVDGLYFDMQRDFILPSHIGTY